MPMRVPLDGADSVAQQAADERQGQETVCDSGAVGRFTSGALDIDVNPLAVARDVRELRDRLLRHLSPWRHHLPADQRAQLRDDRIVEPVNSRPSSG